MRLDPRVYLSFLCARCAVLTALSRSRSWGTCNLASGQVILDCRVGYRTFGALNAERTNVVIVPTWLNGRSEDLLSLFRRWSGPQRLVDTSRFFGVAFDAFGDGISSSPSNSRRQAGASFPRVHHGRHGASAIPCSDGGAACAACPRRGRALDGWSSGLCVGNALS